MNRVEHVMQKDKLLTMSNFTFYHSTLNNRLQQMCLQTSIWGNYVMLADLFPCAIIPFILNYGVKVDIVGRSLALVPLTLD